MESITVYPVLAWKQQDDVSENQREVLEAVLNNSMTKNKSKVENSAKLMLYYVGFRTQHNIKNWNSGAVNWKPKVQLEGENEKKK